MCVCLRVCTHVADSRGKGVDVGLQPIGSELIPDEGHGLLFVLGVGHVVSSLREVLSQSLPHPRRVHAARAGRQLCSCCRSDKGFVSCP